MSEDFGGAVIISYPWVSVEGAERMIQRTAEFMKKAPEKPRPKVNEDKAKHVAVDP